MEISYHDNIQQIYGGINCHGNEELTTSSTTTTSDSNNSDDDSDSIVTDGNNLVVIATNNKNLNVIATDVNINYNLAEMNLYLKQSENSTVSNVPIRDNFNFNIVNNVVAMGIKGECGGGGVVAMGTAATDLTTQPAPATTSTQSEINSHDDKTPPPPQPPPLPTSTQSESNSPNNINTSNITPTFTTTTTANLTTSKSNSPTATQQLLQPTTLPFDGRILHQNTSTYIIDSPTEEEELENYLTTFKQLTNALVYISKRRQCSVAAAVSIATNTSGGGSGVGGGSSCVTMTTPLVHQYKIYNLADKLKKSTQQPQQPQQQQKVPIIPILMCFLCKLSFNTSRVFLAHAAEHAVDLNEEEVGLLGGEGVSAIIQEGGCGAGAGSHGNVSISLLEPLLEEAAVDGAGDAVGELEEEEEEEEEVGEEGDIHHSNETTLPTSLALLLGRSSASTVAKQPATAQHHTLTQRSRSTSLEEECIDLSKQPTPTPTTTNLNPTHTHQTIQQHQHHQTTNLNQPTVLSTNYITGTTIGVCSEHINGRLSTIDCKNCEQILNTTRTLTNLHTRNSCKTLKCPKCNWHYKYQETLEIHMKEKHPENETSCVYCISLQPHPRLARGETYTCGYKPYRCEVCNYSTTTKGNLSIHMQSDKHLNNMSELQQQSGQAGGAAGSDFMVAMATSTSPGGCSLPSPIQQQSPSAKHQPQHQPQPPPPPPHHHQHQHNTTTHNNTSPKSKPNFRCDVCNYETNVARNLRIHMTSEKHTHNICVLQQGMKSVSMATAAAAATTDLNQQALLQAIQMQLLLEQQSRLEKSQGVQASHPQELVDLAYNQALLIQLLTQVQQQDAVSVHQTHRTSDGAVGVGVSGGGMGGGVVGGGDSQPELLEPVNLNPTHVFQCQLCNFVTNNLEDLSTHVNLDRTANANDLEVQTTNNNNYTCKLCSYKTTLKANFQLHCKTDKHLQRLSFLQHLKESGLETKLKYLNTNQNVFITCNVCEFSSNSVQRSLKHQQLEQLHHLQRQSAGIATVELEPNQMFFVQDECSPIGSGSSSGGLLGQLYEDHHSNTNTTTPPTPTPTHHHHQQNQLTRSILQQQQLNFISPTSSTTARPSSTSSSTSSISPRSATTATTTNSTRHTCPYCHYTTSTDSQLTIHLITNHSNSSSSNSADFSSVITSTPRKITCPLCSQSGFNDRLNLELHVMQVHAVSKDGLGKLLQLLGDEEVQVAGAALSRQQPTSPRQHHHHHQPTSPRQRTTPPTPTTTTTTSSNHPNPNPTHQPYNLGGTNTSTNTTTNTITTNSPTATQSSTTTQYPLTISEKHVYKYRCSLCSLAFKTLDKLQLHSNYHAIRDSYRCNNCGKVFRSNATLNKHVECCKSGVGEDLKEAATVGGEVGKEFKLGELEQMANAFGITVDELKKQINIGCHGNEDVVIATNNTDSDTSSNSSSTTTYEDYLNTVQFAEDLYNDPLRKFKCHRCRLAFTRQSYLTAHNKTLLHRKGEKLTYPMEKYLDPNRPFKCDVCKESFTQKNILLVHYNSVSHLHKLKRVGGGGEVGNAAGGDVAAVAMGISVQQSQQASTKHQPTPTNLTTTNSIITNSPANTNSPAAITTNSPAVTNSQDDSKPYKCAICRVAYSQGSTLDIHIRSVLHQTRASKLQEITESTAEKQACTNLINMRCGEEVDEVGSRLEVGNVEFATVAMEMDETNTLTTSQRTYTHLPSRHTSPILKHLLQSYGFELAMQYNEYKQDNLVQQQSLEKFPELIKSSCWLCKKEFSSIWILKSHVEEVHSLNIVKGEDIEQAAVAFKQRLEMNKFDVDNTAGEDEDEEEERVVESVGSVSQQQQQHLLENLQQYEAMLIQAVASQQASSPLPGQQMLFNANLLNLMFAGLNPNVLMMMPPTAFEQVGQVSQASALPGQPNILQHQHQTQPPIKQHQLQPPTQQHQPTHQPTQSQQTHQTTQQVQAVQQPKRARTRITDDQLKILRAHFDINNSPSEEQINTMATQSTLPPKVIKHWFRNTLFKERQRNKDSPYNFNNPPSTTLNLEEYEKTGEARVGVVENAGVGGAGGEEEVKEEVGQVQRVGECEEDGEKFGAVKRRLPSPSQQHPHIKSEEYHHSNLQEQLTTAMLLHLQQQQSAPPPVKKPKKSTPRKLEQLNLLLDNMLPPVVAMGNTAQQQLVAMGTSTQHISMVASTTSATPTHHPQPHTPPTHHHHHHHNAIQPNSPTNSQSNHGNNNSCSNSPTSSTTTEQNLSTPPLSSSGKRANRTRFTDYQIKVLQEFFENNAYPKDDDLEYLSKLLGLSPRVIVVWFQNARQKARKVYENTPVECNAVGGAAAVAMATGGTGTQAADNDTTATSSGRFSRTPGLNYQCKKCLLVFQRYYELIRHQKTHCFKEEDAKRSAQAQAAAAAAAAAAANMISSEESDSSVMSNNYSPGSSSCYGNVDGSTRGGESSRGDIPRGDIPRGDSEALTCDKCSLTFNRIDHWREHQLVHLMNPGLFEGGLLAIGQVAQSSLPSNQMQTSQQAAGSQQQHHSTTPFSQRSSSSPLSLVQPATQPPPPFNPFNLNLFFQGGLPQQQQVSPGSQVEQSQSQQQAPPSVGGGNGKAGIAMQQQPAPPPSLKRKYSTDYNSEDSNTSLGQGQGHVHSHSGGSSHRDKRLRTTILPEQLDYLYAKYQLESNPSRKMLETIANQVNLKKRVVQVWFQNTRARERKGQFRVHSQVINKRCPYCSAVFKIKSALETHLINKHGGQASTLDIDALPDLAVDEGESGEESGDEDGESAGEEDSCHGNGGGTGTGGGGGGVAAIGCGGSLAATSAAAAAQFLNYFNGGGGAIASGHQAGLNSVLDLSKPIDLSGGGVNAAGAAAAVYEGDDSDEDDASGDE